jgi:hypothetical protein
MPFMITTFGFAYNFYVHPPEAMRLFGANPGPITQARVARLLEPDFQAKALRHARKVATHAAEASKAIQKHSLPLLQQLDAYVADYIARAALLLFEKTLRRKENQSEFEMANQLVF